MKFWDNFVADQENRDMLASMTPIFLGFMILFIFLGFMLSWKFVLFLSLVLLGFCAVAIGMIWATQWMDEWANHRLPSQKEKRNGD